MQTSGVAVTVISVVSPKVVVVKPGTFAVTPKVLVKVVLSGPSASVPFFFDATISLLLLGGTILGLSVPLASVPFFFGALLSLLFWEGTILVLSVPLASVHFFFDALIYSLLFWGGTTIFI
jgi:hypothetical protein